MVGAEAGIVLERVAEVLDKLGNPLNPRISSHPAICFSLSVFVALTIYLSIKVTPY